MNVLWLINTSLPEASLILKENPSFFGGWLINASKDLSIQTEINLSIAFPKEGIDNYIELKGERINYYPFKPVKLQDDEIIKDSVIFKQLINVVKPDVVHIFGTEFPHSLSMINCTNKLNIHSVISIQGLVSIYSKHYYASLPARIVYGATIRNILRRDSIYNQMLSFKSRGKFEVETILKSKHIIGRTTWDFSCTSQINPNSTYHFCNETLREEFYKHQWSIEQCEPHSIFLSQGHYPIKGLHYVLEAMPLILEKYPDTKLYVGGMNITRDDNLKSKISMSYYGKYIKKLIKDNNLENRVFFTGPLDEKAMCKRYLDSHVFVSPASIENSPNSLGEAMLLGVPSISSNVGGVTDMMKDKEEGFIYQADAPYMMAYYVTRIFSDNELAIQFSKNARAHAQRTHDRNTNTKRLLEIYNNITI